MAWARSRPPVRSPPPRHVFGVLQPRLSQETTNMIGADSNNRTRRFHVAAAAGRERSDISGCALARDRAPRNYSIAEANSE